jgi:oxygen-independent coproporphyrinogen-3 oxidase
MIKGLYIHIPFCDQICTYCDFCKMVADDDLKVEYLRALVIEMEYFSDLMAKAETIYIGGGTPSSLDNDLLEAFLAELSHVVNLDKVKEFTFEANPNDITVELLDILEKYKISRISMGVQSIDDDLLKFLGRTHNKETIVKALELLRTRKFIVNLDFLYAIPGQTKTHLLKDLAFIKEYSPQHLSYYSLIVEDRTILNYLINHHKVADFPDDLAREFGEIVDAELSKMGFEKYEFSNYAKPGNMSKHNLLYWDMEEYIGIGLYASSQYNFTRLKNPRKIKEYIAGTKKHALNMHEIEDFDPKLDMILMGLRKTEGVNLENYKNRIKSDIYEVYPILKKHLKNGLLEEVDGYLRFTKNGVYLSNQVYVDLI